MRTFVAVILALVVAVNGYGEPDANANGHPTYQERANFNLINVVRVDPVNYKAIYMNGFTPSVANILKSATYPAVAPLYWEPRLGASAYSHSYEMATKNYFDHNSYDGTDTWTRIGTFYACNGGKGENIAAGNAGPLDTSNQWLCDQPMGSNYCPLDGAKDANNYPLDGHRSNIMGANLGSAGVGYAYSSNSDWKSYWTQDFGGACTSQTSPIYSGSHYIIGSNVKFVAVFASGNAATSYSVFINGVSQALTLESGTTNRGSFALTVAATSGCRSYYFTFVANGVTYRYPDTGCLMTNLEGSCTSDFSTSCGGSTSGAAAAATSSTTAKSATSSSTTKAATSSSTTKAATSSTTAKASSSSTTKAATTSTTAKASSTSSGGSTTGSGPAGAQFLYQNGAFQNSWSGLTSGGTYSASASYGGKTCISAQLTDTSQQAIFLSRNPLEANVWNTLSLYGAASSNTQVMIYFNGGYYTTLSFTTSWQSFPIAMSSLGNYSPIGNYYNGSLIIAPQTNGVTTYFSDIQLVNL